MAPSAPPKLSVGDVLAFSDAALTRYMTEHRRPDGRFELDNIDGWDTLPARDRAKFAERLRAGATKAAEANRSHAVDLDQVTARLLGASTNNSASPPRCLQVAQTPEDLEKRQIQDLLDEVSTNPHEYHELLQPWLEYPDSREAYNWMTIFQRQLTSWEYFLAWRNERRGIYDYDAEYSLYVERIQRGYALYRLTQNLAELEADLSSDKKGFDLSEQRRRREQYGLLEVGDGDGFPAYAEAVTKRLAEHGFTQTFQLDPDPAQQDKLTTWIEYLCYGYCWRDRCIENLRDLQPEYDDAWKQLVDAGVLKSGETEERLRTTESAMQRQSEEDAAAKEVELARSAAGAVLAAKDQAIKDPGSSNLTPQACIQMIDKAHTRLDKATAALKRVKRRGNLITDFIRGTFGHKRARRDLEHHGLLQTKDE
ncbi:hypothetical protein N0V88_000684 [Collariella sp. IMI 366227]|nr:hypothetical protein N0V88_000684 [Collariella sp. IMI 366227]